MLPAAKHAATPQGALHEEADRNPAGRHRCFPQYTLLVNTSVAMAWTDHALNPTGPIRGFLDAFEGVIFFYDPGVDHEIWLVDAAAGGFLASLGGNVGITDYRLFVGDSFGNASGGAPYTVQSSRALGFLL
jgi:hypothetical protein